jgi:hypothetical protein
MKEKIRFWLLFHRVVGIAVLPTKTDCRWLVIAMSLRELVVMNHSSRG